ncbi:hypothetical protein KFK14_17635 [Sphingobium phenoxybenzoativorans]|uniref:Uncharacterized protein n=1 Tax=Sphingobium phenoxybenzoativorans TaxID=1592790 RepID=A0A975K4U0_9SPHN|nr:hypothetical protein [Sphingobium phenoxybenzoativorans]QUT04835.1 hypothetical protein KFK14_17635 [Sphingobium phenoxybenzoativorans]
MSDLLKLLDNNVETVVAGLEGLSKDDLNALLAAEKGGKTRSGVMGPIEQALAADDGAHADVAPAEDFEASGAPHQIVPDIDLSHPAVDNDPRETATAEAVRIDFNDPTTSDESAVAQNLKNQRIA